MEYVIEQREFRRNIRTRYYVEANTGGEEEFNTIYDAKAFVDEMVNLYDGTGTTFKICVNGDPSEPFYTIVYREYDKNKNLLTETKIADTDINYPGIELAQTYAEDIMKNKERLAYFSEFGLINHRRHDCYVKKCLFRGWYLMEHYI